MPSNEKAGTKGRSRRGLRRLIWVLSLSILVLLALILFHRPLLTGLARAWVVDEPVAKADAIVILGGGLENRPFAAARLFREGVAPQVLYMNVKLNPAEELGVALPEREQTHRILLSNGVPELSMTMIGNAVGSTFDESCAVRDWAKKSGAKSIMIPTDLFHTRRVRWVFEKQFRGCDTEIKVQAINPLRYEITDWWQHEEGVINFQNEVLKYSFYRLKY